MRFYRSIALWTCVQLISIATSFAQQSSCTVPLIESKSAPAADLLLKNSPIAPGIIIDRIKSCEEENDPKACFDSSKLDPQLSDLYSGTPQPLIQYTQGIPYPNEQDTVTFTQSLAGKSGLVRARVVLTQNPNVAYQLSFSLDAHATLARNALLRALGYTIPSPKYYPKMIVHFSSLEERNTFLDSLVDNTLTSRARWVVGGLDEINKNQLTLTFQDVVIESAVIDVPQMHWGILTETTLNSRRSIQALLVPLTLLDIPESVNLYSFEPAKIFNEGLVFTRPNADLFKNRTSIGDVRWIARKIAKLDRTTWTQIIQAGQYPADIQALIVEKTLGRVNRLMSMLGFTPEDFTPLKYDPHLTYGNVLNGKALKENYDGYALRFTIGDPKSPLRVSELARFFGIEAISNGITYGLNQANNSLQLIGPDRYINRHQQKFFDYLLDHVQNHPNEPYVQPIEIWGGPIAGANVSASRNIVTGTYYGSNSEVQLVDQVSATASVGAFFGVSGIPRLGVGVTPQVSYNRSYVHVRPLTNIKTAWKDHWKNLYVPHFMQNLSKVLAGKADQSAADAMEKFLAQMKTGEMFIVSDGFSGGASTTVGIPLGAILGVLPPLSGINESVSIGAQYALLSRTTIYKSAEGLHVYLSRIKSGTYDLTLDTDFFIKILSVKGSRLSGEAHTKAFVFPEKFNNDEQSKAFQRSLAAIFRRNNPDVMEEEFYPFMIDHEASGKRLRIKVGPWTWSNRENYHRILIAPPFDPEGKYDQKGSARTVIDGQITKVTGSDIYGFFGSLVRRILPFVNIGGGQKGDDPSTNFIGQSKIFSVNTELETTPSRDNHTFTRIQQAHNGWSMNKSRLMMIIDEVTRQLQEFSPNEGLISKDDFSQTKKIQAYTVLWSLLVYEKGLDRMLKILNLDQTSTQDAQLQLIQAMGPQKYLQYCVQNNYRPGFSSGPYLYDLQVEGSIIESSKGQNTLIGCVTPWMSTFYDLRRKLRDHSEIFRDNIRDEDDAQEKIRWINRSIIRLAKDMDIAELIRLVGEDQSFLQIRVSGFRTRDENGDSEYFSNTTGSLNFDISGGPLSDINGSSQILTNELQARYLSDGY